MLVALHSVPQGLFKASPPYSNSELVEFVRKAASLGFTAVQIGPLANYVPIEGQRLKRVLDSFRMERNVHVGGIYDAEKFALTKEEYARVRKETRYGITLCKQITSTLVSIHPPFFAKRSQMNSKLLLKARNRFLKLVEEEADFASRNGIKIALESFCYYPFIFEGLRDFAHFVSNFPAKNLGVLLDIGHLYQMRIDLVEALHLFEDRLSDLHIHDATLEEDYRKATHLPIGKGTINFPDLISRLKEVGYDKWLSLEIRGTEKEIAESKSYLESLITP